MMAAAVVMLVAQMALPLSAANTTPPVYPLTLKDSVVSVTRDWNYTMTSATPFGDNGYVDLVNTEHAVLILTKVKPSAALKLLSHVRINGVTAKEGTNCQVKLYNRGTIILPYTDKGVLTVYDGQNFEGTAVSDFGLENSGGFMNTLTEARLNNKIRSFRLKRGYMVTFSTLPAGRGYSRCFIAADADLELKTLPAVLDGHISSYRLFRWYDTGKQQLAAATGDVAACSALNVTSTYTWGMGSNMLPDVESVVHHIKENWPTAAELGKATWTPHMKTNNEPRNSADDSPCGLDDILANWEDLMATGMRLCSPSSWDGSDYWNGTGFLKEFFKAIDERGWRCDIIDLHGYWTEGSFNTNIPNWYGAVKRPVWVSEWCWGASWNDNGAFASGATEAKLKTALQTICTTMNNQPYVERYFYWNGERDPSKLYKNGKLTPGGEYYATIDAGTGYNAKYEYVPATPKQYDAEEFAVSYDNSSHQATIRWYDRNGEYNQLMEVQRSTDDGASWQTVITPQQQERAARYEVTDENSGDGIAYRLYIKDVNGVNRISAVAYTSANGLSAGTPVVVGDKLLYMGGNILTNGTYELGLQGWTNGAGEPAGQPWFQMVPQGGIDGGRYLQCYGNGSAAEAASLRQRVAIEPGADYLFRFSSCNGGNAQMVNVTASATNDGTLALKFTNSTQWTPFRGTFNSGTNNYAVIIMSNLGGKAQLGQMMLCRLFDSKDAAIADGVRQQALYDETVAMVAQTNALRQRADSLATVAEAFCAYDVTQNPQLQQLVSKVRSAADNSAKADACQALQSVLDDIMPAENARCQPEQPTFVTASGWETAAGSFKGGDQRCNTVDGVHCWNAWWSGVSATAGRNQTLEVRQKVTNLDEGFYTLECQASTEHFCLSDQHGYMVCGNDTASTPVLTSDYWDLQSVLGWSGNIWQTLTTTPLYVPANGTVTIGFMSSKEGAVDNAWHKIGTPATSDKREGWWCATNFRLLRRPVMHLSLTSGQWGTLCAPYSYQMPQEVSCYRVAGILADHTAICLEPVTTVEAGRPVICHATADVTQMLIATGQAVSDVSPAADEQNLIGALEEKLVRTARYMLVDGQWKYIEERDFVPAGSAYFRTFDGMTVYTTWDGPTLPIAQSTAISSLKAGAAGTAAAYTLGGRPATGTRGVVIERNGKTTRKVVR
jgi:hypothetical protein